MTRRSLAILLFAFSWFGWAHISLLAQKGQIPDERPRQATTSSKPSAEPKPTPRPLSRVDESSVPDNDVVRINTDLATVLFTVVDKDKRFLTTLRQEDIRVLEDGVPQEIFTFQRETDRPLSLAILIDVSPSQRVTLPEEKIAALAFVDWLIRSATTKDQVAIISFTGEATLEQELTSDFPDIRRAIDRVDILMPPGYVGGGIIVRSGPPGSVANNDPRTGTTALWDAVWTTAGEVLAKTSYRTRRAIILLTDGMDTSSRLEMSEAIDQTVKADAVIYSIGIGDSVNYQGVNQQSLSALSERTGGRAFFPRNETELRAAFGQLQQELRSQYLVAYSPLNKKRDGSYREVRIEIVNPELRREQLRLIYRQGYFASPSLIPLQERGVP